MSLQVGYGYFIGYLRRENENLRRTLAKPSKCECTSPRTGSYWRLLHAIQIWISKTGTLGSQVGKPIPASAGIAEMPRNGFRTWDPHVSVVEIQICMACGTRQ